MVADEDRFTEPATYKLAGKFDDCYARRMRNRFQWDNEARSRRRSSIFASAEPSLGHSPATG